MNAWPQYMILIFIALAVWKELGDATEKPTAARAVASILLAAFVLAFYVFVLKAGNFFAPLGWPA